MIAPIDSGGDSSTTPVSNFETDLAKFETLLEEQKADNDFNLDISGRIFTSFKALIDKYGTTHATQLKDLVLELDDYLIELYHNTVAAAYVNNYSGEETQTQARDAAQSKINDFQAQFAPATENTSDPLYNFKSIVHAFTVTDLENPANQHLPADLTSTSFNTFATTDIQAEFSHIDAAIVDIHQERAAYILNDYNSTHGSALTLANAPELISLIEKNSSTTELTTYLNTVYAQNLVTSYNQTKITNLTQLLTEGNNIANTVTNALSTFINFVKGKAGSGILYYQNLSDTDKKEIVKLLHNIFDPLYGNTEGKYSTSASLRTMAENYSTVFPELKTKYDGIINALSSVFALHPPYLTHDTNWFLDYFSKNPATPLSYEDLKAATPETDETNFFFFLSGIYYNVPGATVMKSGINDVKAATDALSPYFSSQDFSSQNTQLTLNDTQKLVLINNYTTPAQRTSYLDSLYADSLIQTYNAANKANLSIVNFTAAQTAELIACPTPASANTYLQNIYAQSFESSVQSLQNLLTQQTATFDAALATNILNALNDLNKNFGINHPENQAQLKTVFEAANAYLSTIARLHIVSNIQATDSIEDTETKIQGAINGLKNLFSLSTSPALEDPLYTFKTMLSGLTTQNFLNDFPMGDRNAFITALSTVGTKASGVFRSTMYDQQSTKDFLNALVALRTFKTSSEYDTVFKTEYENLLTTLAATVGWPTSSIANIEGWIDTAINEPMNDFGHSRNHIAYSLLKDNSALVNQLQALINTAKTTVGTVLAPQVMKEWPLASNISGTIASKNAANTDLQLTQDLKNLKNLVLEQQQNNYFDSELSTKVLALVQKLQTNYSSTHSAKINVILGELTPYVNALNNQSTSEITAVIATAANAISLEATSLAPIGPFDFTADMKTFNNLMTQMKELTNFDATLAEQIINQVKVLNARYAVSHTAELKTALEEFNPSLKALYQNLLANLYILQTEKSNLTADDQTAYDAADAAVTTAKATLMAIGYTLTSAQATFDTAKATYDNISSAYTDKQKELDAARATQKQATDAFLYLQTNDPGDLSITYQGKNLMEWGSIASAYPNTISTLENQVNAYLPVVNAYNTAQTNLTAIQTATTKLTAAQTALANTKVMKNQEAELVTLQSKINEYKLAFNATSPPKETDPLYALKSTISTYTATDIYNKYHSLFDDLTAFKTNALQEITNALTPINFKNDLLKFEDLLSQQNNSLVFDYQKTWQFFNSLDQLNQKYAATNPTELKKIFETFNSTKPGEKGYLETLMESLIGYDYVTKGQATAQATLANFKQKFGQDPVGSVAAKATLPTFQTSINNASLTNLDNDYKNIASFKIAKEATVKALAVGKMAEAAARLLPNTMQTLYNVVCKQITDQPIPAGSSKHLTDLFGVIFQKGNDLQNEISSLGDLMGKLADGNDLVADITKGLKDFIDFVKDKSKTGTQYYQNLSTADKKEIIALLHNIFDPLYGSSEGKYSTSASLRTMAENYSEIFPGLKEKYDQIITQLNSIFTANPPYLTNDTKWFLEDFSTNPPTPESYEYEGVTATETNRFFMIGSLYNNVPTTATALSGINNITTSVNAVSTYFNSQNTKVQLEVQTVTNLSNEVLAFLKVAWQALFDMIKTMIDKMNR